MSALFAYPRQAEFGRVLPKSKIYEHARPSGSLRDRFVEEVGQIVWRFKLAPETINLPARGGVPEIQVFGITLKTGELSEGVLRTIDRAIRFPIFYELIHENRIKATAAYKRPSDADTSGWVVKAYFDAPWCSADSPRRPLPVSLDLGSLYEAMLRAHIDVPARDGESLHDQVERIAEIRRKEKERQKLELRMRQEAQFNRKVEVNRALRDLDEELKRLRGPRMTQRSAD